MVQIIVALTTFILILLGYLLYTAGGQENSNNVKSDTLQTSQEDGTAVSNGTTIMKAEEINQDQESMATNTLNAEGSIEKQANKILSGMTLREKVGQMMIVGFNSPAIDNHIVKMIEEYHVGGVILFDRNMKTKDQVAALNKELQQLSKDSSGLPLLLSIDQEGGQIVRMRDQVSPIPSQHQLGQKSLSGEVYNTAKRTGEELLSMGFNLNFAPVVDLSATDSRSFGKDPQKVHSFGRQVVRGMMDSDRKSVV